MIEVSISDIESNSFKSTYTCQNTILCIPGHNGNGSSIEYLQWIIDKNDENNINIVKQNIPTTSNIIDIGQQNCIDAAVDLKKINTVGNKTPSIIHASSQGTATCINALSSIYNIPRLTEETSPKYPLLILESSMATANEGIHSVSKRELKTKYKMKFVDNPLIDLLIYILAPFLVKLLRFRSYNPFGPQPINNIDSLPLDIVVLLIHSEHDTTLHVRNSNAIYYKMLSRGMSNVYYMKLMNSNSHINIFKNQDDILLLHKILSYHLGFNYQNENNEEKHQLYHDIELLKIDHLQFKKDYNNIRLKEYLLLFVFRFLFGGYIFLIIFLLYFFSSINK
jgi:hypothetical protein